MNAQDERITAQIKHIAEQKRIIGLQDRKIHWLENQTPTLKQYIAHKLWKLRHRNAYPVHHNGTPRELR